MRVVRHGACQRVLAASNFERWQIQRDAWWRRVPRWRERASATAAAGNIGVGNEANPIVAEVYLRKTWHCADDREGRAFGRGADHRGRGCRACKQLCGLVANDSAAFAWGHRQCWHDVEFQFVAGL